MKMEYSIVKDLIKVLVNMILVAIIKNYLETLNFKMENKFSELMV